MSKRSANVFLGICGGILVLGYLGSQSDKKPSTNSGASVQRAAYSKPVTLSLEGMMPEAQRSFLVAVRRGQAAYLGGANDMAKGASRPMRARELCSIMGNGRADRWVGTVYSLSSNNDGKGVLTVDLGSDIYIKTWNNSVSDSFDGTLIEPTSQLFASASSLSNKQPVVFSGTFARSKEDCLKESSMTISGSMREPEFIMRFSQIYSIN